LNKSEVAFDLYTTATEPCGDLFTIDLCRQVEPWIIKKNQQQAVTHTWKASGCPLVQVRGERMLLLFYFFNHHMGPINRFRTRGIDVYTAGNEPKFRSTSSLCRNQCGTGAALTNKLFIEMAPA